MLVNERSGRLSSKPGHFESIDVEIVFNSREIFPPRKDARERTCVPKPRKGASSPFNAKNFSHKQSRDCSNKRFIGFSVVNADDKMQMVSRIGKIVNFHAEF